MKRLLKVLVVLSLTVMILMNMASCKSVLDKTPYLDGPSVSTEVTEPEVTEPEVTEPEVTEPEVTEPEVTEPEVTEPATEPEVTEPATEPEVTEPTTEPEVTEPATEPEVTEPEVDPDLPKPVENKVTVSIADYATANGWQNEAKYLSIIADKNITITAATSKNNTYTGKYYTNGNDWRIYQTDGGSITITAADGKTIVSVKITYKSQNTGTLLQGDTPVKSGDIVTVNGSSITLSVGNTGTATNGQARITAIEIIYLGEAEVPSCQHTPADAVVENKVDATCEAEGSYESVVYCSKCSEELSRETKTIDKLDHTPADAVVENEVPATCKAEGSYDLVVKCSACGHEISRTPKTTDKLDHTPADAVVENEVPATCKAEGSYDLVVKCSACGHEISRTPNTIGKLDHTPGVAATCTTAQTCTVCGKTIVAALNHKDENKDNICDRENCKAILCGEGNHIEDEGTVTKDATCEEKGEKTYKCTACGDTLRTEEIPATGHTYIDHEAQAPTCTNKGWEAYQTCEKCKYTSYVEIPATGHTEVKEYKFIDGVLYHVDTCGCVETRETVEADENGIEVATENDIKEVLKAGYNVVLTANIELTSAIEIEGKEVVINLGGYTITADWVDEDGVVEVLWAKGTGTVVTINGEGSMKSGTGSGTNSVVSSTDGAIVNINGGYYYSASYGAVIFTTRNGAVNIYGGKFEAAEQFESKWYVLDIDERVDPEYFGEINVYGGEFVNYDPVNNTNDSAALANKVADGYHSIKNDNSYVVSKHVYESNVTNPTCEAGGYTTHTCVCGDTYVDSYTDALDHSFTNYVSNEDATCTEDGTKTAKCDRCEETKTITDEGSALDHSFTNYASNKDATCTEDGTKTAKCDRCEETKTIADEGSALDHDLIDVEGKNATCTEDGYTAHKACENCDYTEGKTTLPASHDLVNVEAKDPTCTEDGYTAHKACENCDYTEDKTVIDATGHNFVDGECDRDGCHANQIIKEGKFEFGANGSTSHYDGSEKTSYTESNNGYTLTLSGMSKVYGSARDEKGNSCLKLGTGSAVGEFSFTVPDEVTQVIIYIAGYKAEAAKITVNGTSHTISSQSNAGDYTAIEVDTTSTKTVTLTTVSGGYRAMVNAIVFISVSEYDCDHQYNEVTKDATCTVNGSITRTCTECEKVKVEIIPALGHTYDEGVVTAPTCTEAGFTTYTCTNNCGYSYTDNATEATDHAYGEGVVTPPTCVDEGYTTYTCTNNCGHSYTDNTTEATGEHTFENGECTVCGALDHVHSYNKVVTDPTCTEQGYTTYTCSDSECGDTYVDDYVDAKGHTDGETVVENNKAADCVNNGSYDNVVYCSVCGDETSRETVTVDATGHTFVCGACDCGQKLSVETTTSMDIYANKGTTGTNTISWTSNGITFTNTKGSTAIRTSDSDHYRVYANSSVTITGQNITKVVITCQSSYVPSLTNIENATVTTNGTVVTITLTNAADSITFKASAQWRLSNIEVTCIANYSMSDKDTETHEYTSIVVTAPTCGKVGYTTYTCKCGSHTDDEVAALEHNYEAVVTDPTCVEQGYTTHTCTNCEDSYKDSYTDATGEHNFVDGKCTICEQEEGHTHSYTSEVTAPTCVAQGYTTHTCSCGDEYVDSYVDATGEHSYSNGACTVCGAEDPDAVPSWTLVTDVSTLKAGDQIVIVAKSANYALSSTQNSNNRGQASVTKSGNTVTFGSDVQIITLAAGTKSGTFAFNTGSAGYLCAASSSSNYLRTKTTLDDNGSWSITIATDGTATIKAQGSYTRNWLKYNSSSKIFACYSSGQGDVQIYKLG